MLTKMQVSWRRWRVNEDGGDGGIDAAGEAADDVAVADLLANRGDGGLDEVSRGPVAGGFADVEEEVSDELWAERGVVDLGMELHGPDAAFGVGDAGEGVGGDGGAMEAFGEFDGFVAMAHPNLDGRGEIVEQLR